MLDQLDNLHQHQNQFKSKQESAAVIFSLTALPSPSVKYAWKPVKTEPDLLVLRMI